MISLDEIIYDYFSRHTRVVNIHIGELFVIHQFCFVCTGKWNDAWAVGCNTLRESVEINIIF